MLSGGGGNDWLNGGDGNDFLDGSYGNGVMNGGMGKDHVKLELDERKLGRDTVTDFGSTSD